MASGPGKSSIGTFLGGRCCNNEIISFLADDNFFAVTFRRVSR
jgi:hypothetical protein